MKVEKPALSKDRSKIQTLLILLVVLAGALYWSFGTAGSSPATSNSQSPAATAVAAGGKPTALPKPLEFDKLEPVLAETKAERNPFQFYVAPPPPPPPASKLPPPVQTYRPPPTPTGPPPKPAIRLKFLGTEVAPFGTVAILADTDGTVYYGREGDVVNGQYRIDKIGLESVTMEYLDGTGKQAIRIGGAPDAAPGAQG